MSGRSGAGIPELRVGIHLVPSNTKEFGIDFIACARERRYFIGALCLIDSGVIALSFSVIALSFGSVEQFGLRPSLP